MLFKEGNVRNSIPPTSMSGLRTWTTLTIVTIALFKTALLPVNLFRHFGIVQPQMEVPKIK